jgi:16S rRNA (cytidine1402-2'-O)-methyltransferase
MSNRGELFIVGTPIGNLKDISYRGIEVLTNVDMILAEDTRQTNKLLKYYGIKQKTMSCHEHNEDKRISDVHKYLDSGSSVALVSDAGTPLISDPGYKLVSEIKRLGYQVRPIPGPCALIAALSVSGLPSDQFQFKGFLPSKAKNRKHIYKDISSYVGTTIFYESVHRIKGSLEDLVDELGIDREIVMAKELTKQYENVIKGTSQEVLQWVNENPDSIKGEYVLLIRGRSLSKDDQELDSAITLLKDLLPLLALNQAVKVVSKHTGIKKNSLYNIALELKN